MRINQINSKTINLITRPIVFIMSLDLVEYAKAYETKNHSLCEWKMKYYIQITLLVLRLSCSGQKIKKKRDNLKWLIN